MLTLQSSTAAIFIFLSGFGLCAAGVVVLHALWAIVKLWKLKR